MISNLEYRFNYFSDAILQPIASTLIELTLWYAVFASSMRTEIGGFGREYYLAYAMWGAFIARITANWMYEFKMIEEIDSGSVNSALVRPFSFYEYYLSQFLGYKIVTTAISMLIPISVTLWMGAASPVQLSRLPAALGLVVYYLLLVHTISFCVASSALFLNRVYSFTVAKNLMLWLLSGELFPLDLLPSPWKEFLFALPFSCATYIPAAYVTGRIGPELFLRGFVSITVGLIVFGLLAKMLWARGMLRYTGTGA